MALLPLVGPRQGCSGGEGQEGEEGGGGGAWREVWYVLHGVLCD